MTLPIDEALNRFKDNEDRLDKFINSDAGYTASTGEPVESVPHFIERKEAEINAVGAIAATAANKDAAAASAVASANSAASATASAATATAAKNDAVAAAAGLATGGIVGKATKALLDADLAYAADRIGLVTNDPTPANNGYYRKTGASGSGSWVASSYDRVAAVEITANRLSSKLEKAPGKINVWPDPFFRKIDLSTDILANRDRWWGGHVIWSLVSNSVFDGKSLRNANVGGSSNLSGPVLWLDEFGAVAGDTITIYGLLTGPGGNAAFMPGRFFATSPGDWVGGQVNAVDEQNSAGYIFPSATPTRLRMTVVVPAGAIGIALFPYVDANYVDFNSIWAFKGGESSGPAWPSMDSSQNDIAELRTDVAALEVQSQQAAEKSSYAITDITEVSYSGISTTAAVANPSAGLRDYEFCGWAQQFTPQGISFNAIRLPYIAQTVTIEASRWKELHIFVRTGASPLDAGTVVARGYVKIDESQNYQSGIIVVLKDPTTGAVKTLTNADLGSSYMVAVHAKNTAGGRAACGESFGTTAGSAHQSAYFVTAWSSQPETGSWGPYSGDPELGFEHLLLTSPVESLNYAPTQDLKQDLGVANEYAPEVVMPPKLYALQGLEASLYFDNILLSDYRKYDFRVSASTNGTMQQLNERFKWIPAGGVSSGDLTLQVMNKDTGNVLVTKTINLRSAASGNGSGTTKKALFIGDSLINAAVITQTALDLAAADSMGLTLYGTRGSGTNKHEGRGGWSINDYVGPGRTAEVPPNPNPFWIGGALNFSQYLTDNSYLAPDWVFIHLGINDVFGQGSDAGARNLAITEFAKLDSLIASIKAAGAGIKVGLMIPSPPSFEQDSFALSEALGATRARFKRNILIWARELISKYANQEASRIYIVSSNLNLDTENNMARTDVAPINSRSSVTKARQSNGVHPGVEGYRQIGDSVWSFMKYNL